MLQPEGGQGITHAPSFYDRHRAGLGVLFEALDMPREALVAIEDTVAITQPWAKSEHTQGNYPLWLSSDAAISLHGLYQDFGLVEEQPLPPGKYDQIIVLGGMQAGNNRRLAFAANTLLEGDVSTDHLTLLSGQRPMNSKDEKAIVEQNLENIRNRQTADSWARQTTKRPDLLAWETDLMRLAAADHLGPMALRRLHLKLEDPDPVSHYEMDWNGTPVTLLHSRAVSRPGGEPRPTTASCVADWLDIMPPPTGARVALIGGNPHIERMTRSAQAIVSRMGREDLQLIGAGSAANRDQDHHIFLGEIARNLYEDLMAA